MTDLKVLLDILVVKRSVSGGGGGCTKCSSAPATWNAYLVTCKK